MTGADVADLLALPCLVAGALLSLAAGIGLLRFPDTLSRVHAATKPQVLGVLLILVGVGLRLRTPTVLPMLLLIGAFQLITAPITGQMIGRAGYRSRKLRPDLLDVDELADRRVGRGSAARTHGPPRSAGGSASSGTDQPFSGQDDGPRPAP
ncbi:monovalent cation/H(+) antiporter subunit G [Plantactinospora sp. GCM10030261]|uniref:monovalent cation/H(+) antiporter subunit G n=1 Tax=Plantactinospora sp. GCM10030261 TaxID=3273420 RepID=UPI00361003D1